MTDDTFDLNDLVSDQKNSDSASGSNQFISVGDEQVLHKTGVDMLGDLSDEDLPKVKDEQQQPKSKPSLDSEDLANEFQATFSSAKNQNQASGVGDFSDERQNLESLEDKITEKLNQKRKEVEERLDTLKLEKELIAKEIEVIKDLEKTQNEIRSKEKALDALAEDIEKIEDEAEKDLNSL